MAQADCRSRAIDETVTVIGLMRMGFLRKNDPANAQWYSRDVAAIAQAQGLSRPAPYFIDQGVPARLASLCKGRGRHRSPAPRHDSHPVPEQSSGLCAYTWYGLAAMVLGAAWLVRRHDKAVAAN